MQAALAWLLKRPRQRAADSRHVISAAPARKPPGRHTYLASDTLARLNAIARKAEQQPEPKENS
jgi:hypothetical protein